MRQSTLVFCAISSLTLIVWSVPKVEATSVYVVTNHLSSNVRVYDIEDDQIELQLICDDFPHKGYGAVDLTLSSYDDMLFASYDNENIITMYNAKTMEDKGYVTPPGEIAGMDFDDENQRLLAIHREDDELYIFDYDPLAKNLTYNASKILEIPGPYFLNGYGICLDEIKQYLYVSDSSNIVRYYDASDPNFTYLGNIEIEDNETAYEAVGIALYNDGEGHKYLYSGAWVHGGLNNYLVRTDLNIQNPNDPNYIIAKNIGTSVLGVAVNHDESYNGLVYVTTADNRVAVYDTSNCANDPNEYAYPTDYETEGVSGPAGLVVGSQYKPPLLPLTKTDDVADPNGCVSPGDIFNYAICFDPNTALENVWLTDFLPPEVDLLWADPNYTDFDPDTNIVKWYLGDLDPNDPNTCVYLWVEVNESAEPNGTILNPCEIESETSYNTAEEITPVCCWSEIIYVDQSATGYQNGMTWQHAFTELYDALDLARSGCGLEIRVAQGSYVPKLIQDEPENWYYESFQMVNGVAVYGGFPTGGGEWDERDWLENETILGGNGQTEYELPQVVTFNSCNENTILDGFIITDSYSNYEDAYGLYIENGSPTVTHNRITGHEEYGIYVTGGYPRIDRNHIDHNDAFGIYLEGTTPTVTHNYIHDNGYGLFADNNSAPCTTNNMIYRNDQTGIYLNNSPSDTILRNNTIAYNQGDGVVKWGGAADPNIVMLNCIVWKNEGEQILYCPAKYSCIYDPINDPNGINMEVDENGNITTHPLFYSVEDDDFHLDPNSPCIDMGDPEGWYEDEKDIDGHKRVLDGGNELRVDMGADEFCGGTDTNYADFNSDGFVDLFDYAELAAAWLTVPPGMNPLYDLNADEIVSLVDLSLFTDEWLWMACWQPQTTMMMSQGGGMEMRSSQSSMTATTVVEKTPPTVVELTAEQFAELIEDLNKLWETNEEFRRGTEGPWEEALKFMYEYLEKLRQSEEKK